MDDELFDILEDLYEEVDDILNGRLQISGIRAGVKTKNGITSYIDF